jgi:hypothetical protein
MTNESSYATGFTVRVPENGLQCSCGHRLRGYDFDILEPHLIRAVCSRCHKDLVVIEIR